MMATEGDAVVPLMSYDDFLKLEIPGEVIEGVLYLGGRRVKDWRKLAELLDDGDEDG